MNTDEIIIFTEFPDALKIYKASDGAYFLKLREVQAYALSIPNGTFLEIPRPSNLPPLPPDPIPVNEQWVKFPTLWQWRGDFSISGNVQLLPVPSVENRMWVYRIITTSGGSQSKELRWGALESQRLMVGVGDFVMCTSDGWIKIENALRMTQLEANVATVIAQNSALIPKILPSVIEIEGRIGLNTNNPISKLHIQGNDSSMSDEVLIALTGNGENGKSILFKNGFGDLAKITASKLGSGSHANEGVIIFETAFDSVLSKKLIITSSGDFGFRNQNPVSVIHVGDGLNINRTFLLLHGFSDSFPLQEWGDNNLVWLRFFRTSTNKLKFVTSNYGGSSLDFEGIYNFVNQLGIGNVTPHASSMLDVVSTTKGVLLPRMTTAQINGIVSPAEGLEVYNITLKKKCFFNGTSWQQVSSFNMN